MTSATGKLYLIPSPLGEEFHDIHPAYVRDVVSQIKFFICERGKTSRAFLKTMDVPFVFSEMEFFELNKYTDKGDLDSFLQPALDGYDIGLMSEAGCPGVADPGARIVMLAHKKNIEVIPLIGPSSILLALMASGMNGQKFRFNGYIPLKGPDRIKALRELERNSEQLNQTEILIETPYRNEALVKDVFSTLMGDTLFCIAMDITLPGQFIMTASVSEWKQRSLPAMHKRPAIFLVYRSR